ncbi:MAG: hypothetical protein LIO93_12285, partial [Bacteroidales bacterium]|nr:hypothetical protein [Bacteroidales bacterium]
TMNRLIFTFLIVGLLFPLSAQNSSVKKDTTGKSVPFAMKRLSTKELKEMEGDFVSTKEDYYPFIQTALSEGKICNIYYTSKEAIEGFFKNYTPVIVPEYFLFGIFGSKKIPQENSSLINEEDNDHPWVVFIRNYIRQTLGEEIIISEDEKGIIRSYSPELARVMNSFFNESTGDLKFELFDTNEKICSYLAGVYYRSGRKAETLPVHESYLNEGMINATPYEIDFFDIDIEKLFLLLKKVCCNNILYSSTSIRGFVPGRTGLFFEPSVYLEKYFEWIEPEKLKLEKLRWEYEKTIFKDTPEKKNKSQFSPRTDIEAFKGFEISDELEE